MEQEAVSYPSDLTDDQWIVLTRLIGTKTGAGRPLKHGLTANRQCHLVCDPLRDPLA